MKTSLSSQATTTEKLDWSRDRLLSWAEELFCDLFATVVVGPCYSLAYVELFGLTTVLNADPSVPSGYSLTTESTIFSRSHPADFFRLKQHVALLRGNSGWWKKVEAIRSHYVDVLEAAASVSDADFVFYTHEQAQPYADATLQGFFALTSSLQNVVSEVTQSLDPGVSEYERFGGLIEDHLERAVVPSTVFDGRYHWYPDTVALLNASMKFSLESLEKLMKSVKDQKPFIAGHRSRWVNRIESLTSKAIEDHYLLATEKGTVSVGGSFKRADLSSTE